MHDSNIRINLSDMQDSDLRPHAPKACALPDWANVRKKWWVSVFKGHTIISYPFLRNGFHISNHFVRMAGLGPATHRLKVYCSEPTELHPHDESFNEFSFSTLFSRIQNIYLDLSSHWAYIIVGLSGFQIFNLLIGFTNQSHCIH